MNQHRPKHLCRNRRNIAPGEHHRVHVPERADACRNDFRLDIKITEDVHNIGNQLHAVFTDIIKPSNKG